MVYTQFDCGLPLNLIWIQAYKEVWGYAVSLKALVAVHFTKVGSNESRALSFYWLLAYSEQNVKILKTAIQKQYQKYKDGLFPSTETTQKYIKWNREILGIGMI